MSEQELQDALFIQVKSNAALRADLAAANAEIERLRQALQLIVDWDKEKINAPLLRPYHIDIIEYAQAVLDQTFTPPE